MSIAFGDLPENVAAPVRTKKKKGDRPGIIKKCRLPFLKRAFLRDDGDGESMSSADLLAKIKDDYHSDSAKGIGDAMGKGDGNGDRRGLDLFKLSDDTFPMCLENVVKFIRTVKTEDELQKLATDLGFVDKATLFAAAAKLPKFETL